MLVFLKGFVLFLCLTVPSQKRSIAFHGWNQLSASFILDGED